MRGRCRWMEALPGPARTFCTELILVLGSRTQSPSHCMKASSAR